MFINKTSILRGPSDTLDQPKACVWNLYLRILISDLQFAVDVRRPSHASLFTPLSPQPLWLAYLSLVHLPSLGRTTFRLR